MWESNPPGASKYPSPVLKTGRTTGQRDASNREPKPRRAYDQAAINYSKTAPTNTTRLKIFSKGCKIIKYQIVQPYKNRTFASQKCSFSSPTHLIYPV